MAQDALAAKSSTGLARRPPSAPGGGAGLGPTPPSCSRPVGTPRRPLTARSDNRQEQNSPGVADLLYSLVRGEEAGSAGSAGSLENVPVALVLECLEVAMLKLGMVQHPRNLIGTPFLTRTLPASLEAAQHHLRAAHAAKIMHMREVEEYQEHLRQQARQLESQLDEIKKQAKVHRSQARQAHDVREHLDDITEGLQARLDAASQGCDRLRNEIDDKLRDEREAFEQEKARLTQRKAELIAQLQQVREKMPVALARTNQVRAQAGQAKAELDIKEADANEAGALKVALKGTTDDCTNMTRQIQELEAKKGKKKGRRSTLKKG